MTDRTSARFDLPGGRDDGAGRIESDPPRLEIFIAYSLDIIRTAEDERVCPICAPLDGLVIDSRMDPWPPFHGNCRCSRHHFMDVWQTRLV